jgi:large subunit ribosomal protein L18
MKDWWEINQRLIKETSMRKKLKKIKNVSLLKRYRRKLGIRAKLNGTALRPRICLNKTNRNIFVQIIDDGEGKTIFSVQTFGKNAVEGARNTVDGAKLVGKVVAQKLKEKNITQISYDRNGYMYTGVIAALADELRENGIKI